LYATLKPIRDLARVSSAQHLDQPVGLGKAGRTVTRQQIG
jgi:hypothetical protein